MNRDEAYTRITQLRSELDRHNYKYYVQSSPEISDYDFDIMMNELIDLETKFPEFSDQNSPSQRVGNDSLNEFVQVAHIFPMLSLSNTYSEAELIDFDRRVLKDTGFNVNYVCELKFDGVSISLIYEKGVLSRAVTRGDGVSGDDVTQNVKTIKSIPLKLHGSDFPDLLEIRGEIVMPFAVFKKLNSEREKAGEQLMANPRNATSGTVKLQDSSVVSKRNLDAYFYFIPGEIAVADSHFKNLQKAASWGFKTSEHTKLCSNIDEVLRFINYWDIERHNLPVATDGVVVKVDSIELQNELGTTAKSPRWAVAFKFKAEKVRTKLLSVSFQVGRTGAITPVANLEPVQLAGTVVKRASLHNADIIASLGLHVNDWVYVEKGGEIIPKIVGVDDSDRHPMNSAIEFIKECPECGSALFRNEGESAHYCPNETGCPPQIKGKIEHFISRKAMNIDGLGEETVDLLFSSGLICSVKDLYLLKIEQLIPLERMGEKSAMRIINSINDSKNIPFERVLFALGIRYVGETVAKILAKSFRSMENLQKATLEELTRVDEIGGRIAESIVNFFRNEANIELLQKLQIAGLKFESETKEIVELSDKLRGLSFVISGTFEKYSREQLKEMIELNGGKNLSSVTGKTSFFLAGNNVGPSKLEKVVKLEIPMLSEDEFLKMLL